jgi:hypothetical protein
MFLRSPDGTLTDIGTCDGVASPIDGPINNSNQITGFNYGPPQSPHDNGFLWDPALGMTPISPVTGDGEIVTRALNDSGVVVGYSNPTSGPPCVHPFVWDRVSGTRAMSVLSDTSCYGEAHGINDTNTIVGGSKTAVGDYHACIWGASGSIADLNDRVLDASGWQYLQQASVINNAGQIAGYGLRTDGSRHAFILNPTNCAGPNLTSQPTSASPIHLGSAVFSVAATAGGGPFAYQWRHAGLPLTDALGHIYGANTANLTITNADNADAGGYDCVIANGCGTATSDPAMLTIQTHCPADLDNGTGAGTPDSGIDINDLLFFLAHFEAGC